uniref:Uncharacterized protein n=1 Tax=Tetranychus urticae TaxID=32264 RepID=T1KNA6_TETUR
MLFIFSWLLPLNLVNTNIEFHTLLTSIHK